MKTKKFPMIALAAATCAIASTRFRDQTSFGMNSNLAGDAGKKMIGISNDVTTTLVGGGKLGHDVMQGDSSGVNDLAINDGAIKHGGGMGGVTDDVTAASLKQSGVGSEYERERDGTGTEFGQADPKQDHDRAATLTGAGATS